MSNRSRLFGAVGAAVFLAATWSSTAHAQVERCQAELVKASGKATILGLGHARRLAINNWQREVRQKYGERFMDFTNARQARHECESASIGVLGQLNKRCSVSGHPCSTGSVVDDVDAGQGSDNTFTVQRLLARLSYLSREQVDGEFGPITRQAVRNFQRDEKISVTGEVDDETLRLLRARVERRAS